MSEFTESFRLETKRRSSKSLQSTSLERLFQDGGIGQQSVSKTTYIRTGALYLRSGARQSASALGDRSTLPIKESLREQLFWALAKNKILYSQFASHLDRRWRDYTFRELDRLMDSEEWDNEALLSKDSFWTFLRFTTFSKPKALPCLAMTTNGNLVATWYGDKQESVNLEFQAGDQVRWFVSHVTEEFLEVASGTCLVARVTALLSPFGAASWMNRDGT